MRAFTGECFDRILLQLNKPTYIHCNVLLAVFSSLKVNERRIPTNHMELKGLGRPPLSATDPGSNPAFTRQDFSGSGHTSDLTNDTPVSTLPGVWRYWVSADWLAPCQYTATGRGSKLDLQLLPQCGRPPRWPSG